MAIDQELSQRLTRLFAQEAGQLRILLAYLFGSQARGQGGPISDYDFAVLFSSEPSARERSALTHRLVQLLGTDRVDLVVLNRAPIELCYSAIAAGCLLHEADQASRVEFEARILSRYFDYLPVLRHQRAELLAERNYEAGIQRYRAAFGKTQDVLAQARAA